MDTIRSDQVLYGPRGDVLSNPRELAETLSTELEETRQDLRITQRRAEEYAYELLNNYADRQQRHDLRAKDRRRLAKQARDIWAIDPQAGAAVDLMNDFTFGRGVPKPRAKDELVQEVLDEAWDDPDNQLILTSYDAQVTRGTDLSLQCNILFLIFDDGNDGKVKLSFLNHDTVEEAVRDEEMRQRVLYYMTRELKEEWDYERDAVKSDPQKIETRYYEHWHNVAFAEEEGRKVKTPPKDKLGDGKVYHVAINKTGEMVFGVPLMRRLVKWFTAYNEFMASRVDLTKAAAALIMKRKVTGGPDKVRSMAAQEVTRSSGELSGLSEGERRMPGGILVENESLSHEPFRIPTGAGDAMQDGQMIRSQISAATRFPQHYLGDAGSANLATATAMELPVLKAVESRQEVWEGVYRWFIDRVIERAVETGRISEALSPDEFQEAVRHQATTELVEAYGEDWAKRDDARELLAGHEDKARDEVATQRDLGYQFKMPNPLRRMLTDLISAVDTIAKTFDPNGTNIELTRFLLGVALSEGLEVEDAQDIVDSIFPEDYEDPAVAAFNAQQQADTPPDQPPSTEGADGQQHTAANAYGAKQSSSAAAPEQMQQAAHRPAQYRQVVTRLGRGGEAITRVTEARYVELGDAAKELGERRKRKVVNEWDDVVGIAERAVREMDDEGVLEPVT